MNFIRKIDMDYVRVSLMYEGYIRMEFKKEISITHIEAKEVNECVGILSNGGQLPVMILAHELTIFESTAREFSASEEGVKYTTAEALVVRNLAQRLIANFYIKVNKPVKPCKMFDKESEALKWLLTYK